MSNLSICQIARLGTIEYRQAVEWQKRLVRDVQGGLRPNILLLLEHPHVYTTGRLGKSEHLPSTYDSFETKSVPIIETDRGGQVTYHGPGQIVGYPIIDLKAWGGPLKYVRSLEQVIIATLDDLGIGARVIPGLTGVWVDESKIAAIGVKISRGVTYHGFSLNVKPNLAYYADIIPCGITDRGITSVEELGIVKPRLELVQEFLCRRFGQILGYEMKKVDSRSLVQELTVH